MRETESEQESWGRWKKLAFRVLYTYIILFIVTLLLSPLLESTINWFAKTILGYGSEVKLESTGSGDRVFDYVRLTFNVCLTSIIVAVWSLLDRKERDYHRQYNLLTVIIRVILFLSMLLYGFGKVFKGQFPDHSFEKLVQTVGELSPMGLAWTFMGHSHSYNIFIGLAEVLGGTLMLSRKTTTLGSIIILGVMSNVFMMNMTYDIPVKIVSAHIVFFSLILILADQKRLVDFFIKNEQVSKKPIQPTFKQARTNSVLSSIKKLLVVLIAVIVLIQLLVKFDMREQLKEKSEISGLWETQRFEKNGKLLPPLITDSSRWHYFIVEKKREAVVKKMTGELDRFQTKVDTVEKQIWLSTEIDSVGLPLSYEIPDVNRLELHGIVGGDTLKISLQKKELDDFRLINRGFHWINERPFNR
ncbi:MAG: DoxX family protein [Saprospiraceae bacterium]|nr:DoxX family protein [Saprospiraceae bacterium]